jgi:Flp pilus assembly protein TadD
VQPLEPPETHYLSAAIGWLELGNPAEAAAELERLSPARQHHPDILEARWLICADLKRWEEGLQTARTLLEVEPQRVTGWLNQAYALRRVPGGSVKDAWKALLPAYEKFPAEPTVAYNLACYACQMQQMDTARTWLERAFAIGGKERMQPMALADPDLEPLWEEIREG